MLNIPCVIFAGGKSSRMGEDKTLLPFAGFSTLTEYQYSRLSKIFKDVYISTKFQNKFHFHANFIVDNLEDETLYAPTSGFISAFETLKTEKIFVLSVDAPFVGENEIQKLLNADKDDKDATVAQTPRGVEPMCGIYHRSLLDSFLNMQKKNSHKLRYLLKNSKTHYVHFEDERLFLNLNHPHEYKEALLLVES